MLLGMSALSENVKSRSAIPVSISLTKYPIALPIVRLVMNACQASESYGQTGKSIFPKLYNDIISI